VVDLLLEIMVEHILHFTLSIDDMLGNFLILFRTEMSLSRLLDILLVNFLSHLVHLDLLVQNLANRVLLLLTLDFAGHLEAIVLFFQGLELLLILYFFLARAHQIHLKSFASVPQHTVSIVYIILLRSRQDGLVLFRVERGLLNKPIVQRFLFVILELHIVFFCLVAEDERLSLQVEHALVLLGFSQSRCLGVQFFFVWGLHEPTGHLVVIFVFLYRPRWPDLALLLQFLTDILAPFKRGILLCLLHIVAMGIGEVIEAICLVVVVLQLLIHSFLSYALLDVLTVLLLHGGLLLNLNLVELVHLLLDAHVFKPFLLQVEYFLLGAGLCPRLSDLHVLLHILSRVLIGRLVEEECSLASIKFFLQEGLEGHLRQELIVFERLENFVLHLTRVERAVPSPCLEGVIGIGHRELAVYLVGIDTKITLVERVAQQVL